MNSISNIMKNHIANSFNLKSDLMKNGLWTSENIANICRTITEVQSAEIIDTPHAIVLTIDCPCDINSMNNYITDKVYSKIEESFSSELHNTGIRADMLVNISLLPKTNKLILYI